MKFAFPSLGQSLCKKGKGSLLPHLCEISWAQGILETWSVSNELQRTLVIERQSLGHKEICFQDIFMLKKDTVASGYCDTLTHSQRSNAVTDEYCNALLSFSHSFLFGQERRRRPPKFKIADSWKEIYSRMLYSIIRKIWTFFLVLSVHLRYTRGHRCCITEF